MFENKPNSQNQMGQGNAVPKNLPVNPGPTQSTIKPKEPEDILAGIENDQSSIKGPSKPSANISFGTTVPPAFVPKKPESREPFLKQYKKIIVAVIIAVLGLALFAAAAWYGYNTFFSQGQQLGTPVINSGQSNTNQPKANTNQQQVNQNANINQNINQPSPEPAVAPEEEDIDTDRDGLSDREERLYGTDLTKVDTDEDGLTDRDEIKVFKTDPTNPDTDGDTYLDGDEVRAGYDPKGDGKLLKIE
jgi:hypothetical protein